MEGPSILAKNKPHWLKMVFHKSLVGVVFAQHGQKTRFMK